MTTPAKKKPKKPAQNQFALIDPDYVMLALSTLVSEFNEKLETMAIAPEEAAVTAREIFEIAKVAAVLDVANKKTK